MQMTIKLPFSILEWQLQENDIKLLPEEPSQDSIRYSGLSLWRVPSKSYLFSALITKMGQSPIFFIIIFAFRTLFGLALRAVKNLLWMLKHMTAEGYWVLSRFIWGYGFVVHGAPPSLGYQGSCSIPEFSFVRTALSQVLNTGWATCSNSIQSQSLSQMLGPIRAFRVRENPEAGGRSQGTSTQLIWLEFPRAYSIVGKRDSHVTLHTYRSNSGSN